MQLKGSPLCAYCERSGRTTAATVADHIEPHRGDAALFRGPLQSLCATCHSSIKQREENGSAGCDVNGYPISKSHPWNVSATKGNK